MTPATSVAVQALNSALTAFIEELIRFLDTAVELFITVSLASASMVGEMVGAEVGRRMVAAQYAALERLYGRDLDEQWRQVAPSWMRATEA